MRRSLPILLALTCLFASVRSFAAGKAVTDATPADKAAAAKAYSKGMVAFDKNQLEDALTGFRESYAQVKSPNSHFMVARTLARLGRNAEAYDELNGTIAEADGLGAKYADTVHAAYAKLDEIKPRVGFVVVTVVNAPKGTSIMVGDEPVDAPRLGKPIAVLPGDTQISASEPGKPKRIEKVHVDPGGTQSVKLDLSTPDPAIKPPEPVYHPPYRVELEADVVGETLAPPYPVTRGAGAGIRGSFPVVDRGVLGNMDNFALSAGLDWIGSSTDPHFFIPFELQWNLWLTQEFSLRFEPGVALMFGAGTRVVPSLYAGARYRIWRQLYVQGRVGIPVATIGVSMLF
ncbi:MAG TPA: hypothetical protein VH062_31590 [Polyangiaceae bacterium]|nr:hypothetical protein [Polyangiaceae bacterium]